MTWANAQKTCRQRNGQLAILPTMNEWKFLMRIKNRLISFDSFKFILKTKISVFLIMLGLA